ncbi:MAG TPA: signal recognition particle-docking protein FtsY, partial [bacterium]|nr:signal recognition particle-docking protein FtsY [bacterium]
AKLRTLFAKPLDDAALEKLEQLLIEADLGAATAAELTETVRKLSKHHSPEELLPLLKTHLLSLFPPTAPIPLASPHVILLVGINGSGKTTTLAKLASHFRSQGKNVLIGAADTFRAAAVEQLELWAKKLDIPIVKSKPGSDPAAVAFDAITAARARHSDIVLIDTAGRLQTKTDLMHELAKVRKTCQKLLPDAPHETLLVCDATLGQNSLDQAKIFHHFTPLTGIILTKLDGSAKGGIAIALQKELAIPIRWIGLGESENDLAPFDPNSYLDGLLGL